MKKEEADVRFSKFGTVSFTSITKVNDFIDHLENGRVMGTRCKACGETFFPPRNDCSKCLAQDMDWFEVAGDGKLVSYSNLKYAPIGFDADLPYAIALLDFGAYKVFGRIDSALAEEDIKIGMPMKVTVNKLPDGRLNYVFRKAE
jgi:uncharacterized OB-fold protein